MAMISRAHAEICQCGIVAQQKAEPFVVVLDIQRWPHMGRHLIHKAEDAVVGTLVHLVHQIGRKVQSQILSLLLPDGHVPGLSLPFQQQHRFGIIPVKPVVQYIHNLMAVDLQQPFAHGDPGFFRR